MEPQLARRPELSAEVWEMGARSFLGITGISEKKLRVEGAWGANVVFLGYYINLEEDLISLPDPKIAGAANLLASSVFDTGNYVIGLRNIQELRGCVNHWACTGRVWKWLIPPINQLLGYADSLGIWIRCNEPEVRDAFWHTIQFMREMVADETNWPVLFTGVFSELIGIHQELTLPNIDRTATWFSADATLTCIGGVNWRTKEFSVSDPVEYIAPLCPSTRQQGHISEIEFMVEVLCTVVWGVNNPSFILCGLTDNTCSNTWIMSGKARHGVALTLTRTFHKWLIRQHFRFFSFFIRSGHNVSADSLSRANSHEIDQWALDRQMNRIHPLNTWVQFCIANRIPTIEVSEKVQIQTITNRDLNFRVVEWQPGAFTLVQAAKELQLRCEWVGHRHSKIVRVAQGWV